MYQEIEAKIAYDGPELNPVEERGPSEIDKRIMEGNEINYLHGENTERLARLVRKLTGPVPEDPNKEASMKEPLGALEAFDLVLNDSRKYGTNIHDLISRLEQLI